MHLEKISVVNFKNHLEAEYVFSDAINCFTGNNGVGKTNILDAIYYLSFAKSYFNSVAVQNIKHGEEFFMIEGNYLLNERNEKIVCSLKKGQKKVLKRNDKTYEKFSDHIGQLPLVIISPADRDLIVEGSDTRRKFIDGVISQQDKKYLQNLLAYGKVVQQRNALLKFFAANRTFDALNLKVYDEQLIQYGTVIHEKRKAFVEQFAPIFNKKHEVISGNEEKVNLKYKSQLFENDFEALLAKSLEKDKIIQYTTVGVHKDDLSFEIGEYPIKKFGSQGQQKSFLIALKLAQFEFIKEQVNITPILLLDDIFDKLDHDRVSHLMRLISDHIFGQVFISDTDEDRIEKVFKGITIDRKVFKVKGGTIEER